MPILTHSRQSHAARLVSRLRCISLPRSALAWVKACVCCLVFCGASASAGDTDFSLSDTDGQVHTSRTHRGKWLLVNFWATWCPPCLAEMPDLETLSQAHKDLVVLGVAVDGAGNAGLMDVVRKLHITYPIVAGNQASARQFAPRGYPLSVLFDTTGRQVMVKEGIIAREQIEQYLTDAKP